MFDWFSYSHHFDIPLFGIFYAVLESYFPFKMGVAGLRRPEVFQDIIWLYFNEWVAPFLTRYLNLIFIFLFWNRLSSYLVFSKFQLSPLLTLAAVFFWRDFAFWLNHLLAHRIKFLWRFHELHHSSTKMDWLAGFRGYWLDNFFFDTSMGFIFFFVDVSSDFMFLWGYFELNTTYFIHTNTRFKLGFLSQWINNPYTHHWHHAKESKFKGGQNFGGYTLIWDHLFGTFYVPQKYGPPEVYGIASNAPYPSGFVKRFFHPFQKRDS